MPHPPLSATVFPEISILWLTSTRMPSFSFRTDVLFSIVES